MAFWTTTPERDPKRNFRFQVLMTGIQGTEPAVWWAKKVAKPNFTVAESKHVYLGHTFYYPGKVEWQTISMTLVDPVDPQSTWPSHLASYLNNSSFRRYFYLARLKEQRVVDLD